MKSPGPVEELCEHPWVFLLMRISQMLNQSLARSGQMPATLNTVVKGAASRRAATANCYFAHRNTNRCIGEFLGIHVIEAAELDRVEIPANRIDVPAPERSHPAPLAKQMVTLLEPNW